MMATLSDDIPHWGDKWRDWALFGT